MMGPVASDDQKSYVTLHFDHLDPINAVAPLMVLLASCEADASANSIK